MGANAASLASPEFAQAVLVAAAFLCGFGICAAAALVAGMLRKRKRNRRMQGLEHVLERASLGLDPGFLPSSDDELSRLQDEVSKSVMALRHARTEAEKARARHAANLANIAHQSKTPVTVMSLAVQRLKPAATADQEQALQTIETQLERLSRLQHELLQCARIDSGALDVNPSEQDVFTLLSAVADSLEELSSAQDVSIEITSEQPAAIFADPHWMHEALANVTKNCLEHAPAGSAVFLRYDASPLFLEITVEDEGPGIAPERLACVFDRFNHEDDVRTSGLPGATGLGLSFARDLIELQGGSIRVANRPEGGTRFTIRLDKHGLGHSGVTFAS